MAYVTSMPKMGGFVGFKFLRNDECEHTDLNSSGESGDTALGVGLTLSG